MRGQLQGSLGEQRALFRAYLDGVVVADNEILVVGSVKAREAASGVLEASIAPRDGPVAFIPLHQRGVSARTHAAPLQVRCGSHSANSNEQRSIGTDGGGGLRKGAR